MDLVDGARRQHEQAVEWFMHFEHRLRSQRAEGRQHGTEVRTRLREEGARAALRTQIGALDEALARNGGAVIEMGRGVEAFLRSMREQTAEIARRGVEAVEARRAREEGTARPSFSPSPY